MTKSITFTRFEILERLNSPNAVMGVTPEGKHVFITAPASSLGKELGDKMANQIKEDMNKFEYINSHMPQVKCEKCNNLQVHSFPMTGKLYCVACGNLLDEV